MQVVTLAEEQEVFYSNIFLVPKRGSNETCDKPINWTVIMQHFKVEGMHTLTEIPKPRDLTKVL